MPLTPNSAPLALANLHKSLSSPQQSFAPKLLEQLTSSSLIIIEEAQQAADIRTAFATSPLLLYQRDEAESRGLWRHGWDPSTSQGLDRHPHTLTTCHFFPALEAATAAQPPYRQVNTTDLALHCNEIAAPTANFLPYREGALPTTVNAITQWLEPLLPEPHDAGSRLDLSNPLGFVIAFKNLHSTDWNNCIYSGPAACVVSRESTGCPMDHIPWCRSHKWGYRIAIAGM